jgi:predicted O-methyltransferase YrrM
MPTATIIRDTLHYLQGWGHVVFEGSAGPDELAYLAEVVRRVRAESVLEIGFNAGMSSQALLSASPRTRVVSFDLGLHPYVDRAKRYIDRRFPGRHQLVVGDSRETLPEYARTHPDAAFDLAFVDGGHEVEVVREDLRNAGKLCRAGAHVLVDDLTPWRPWGVGPAAAWQEALDQGLVASEETMADGRLVETAREPADRVVALGRYV